MKKSELFTLRQPERDEITKPLNKYGISSIDRLVGRKIPPIKEKDCIRLLIAWGFVEVRRSGSHRQFCKEGNENIISVSVHSNHDLDIGTRNNILKRADLYDQVLDLGLEEAIEKGKEERRGKS